MPARTRSTPARRPPRGQGPLSGSARAARYVAGVLSGEVVACEWVRLACKRHADDLERKRWKYEYDVERADKRVRFVEALPHIKGSKFAGKKIELSDWQCFIVCCVFGWVHKVSRLRRFRSVYIEVARKNGKSTLSAPVGLSCLCIDNEPGAEVYSAATTKDQAKIVWKDAKRMVDRSADLRSAFGVKTSAYSILIERQASSFLPLSRDQQGNLDGLNVHCAVIDELHGHKTRDVWDVLETATGSREQPILWAITTAGSNRTGICYEQRTYVTTILKGQHKDDTYFGIIYTIDEKDDPFDESVWVKANPNLGISVDIDDMRRKALKARKMASALNNFKTKHLDVWVNADKAWLAVDAWDKCYDPAFNVDDFEGEECIIACDLATKTDLAAKVRIFWRVVNDKLHVYVTQRFYVPEDAVEEERNASYSGWVEEGYLTATPGGATDFATIETDIREDCEEYDVVDAVFDPWQAAYMINNLTEDGLNAAEYRQNVRNMSTPMKELEAMIIEGRIHHDGNPVMSWCVGNIVCHEDVKENVYPRKAAKENRIDGGVALIMAIGRLLAHNGGDGDFADFLSNPVTAA